MKTRLFISIILLTFLITSCSNNKLITIDVSDYGITPNNTENIIPKINQLIASLDDSTHVKIVFPKGRYDFYPDSNYFKEYFESNSFDVNPKHLAVFIEKKRNISIDANGSDFIFHAHMQPFTLDNSENITIKNVNIDWDIPLTGESEVIEATSTHFLLKIDTLQFPFEISPQNGIDFLGEGWTAPWGLSQWSGLIEIDNNHIIPANTGDHGCVRYEDQEKLVYSKVGPGLLRIEGNFTKLPGIGNHLIMRHSTRDHAGMFLFHSKDTKLENINVYHTSGLGILSQYCENIEMRNVNVIPNPHKNRFLSGHDDGLHFMGCKGEIIIDNCDAQGLMDDPINIHGTSVPIVELLSDTKVKCNFAHSMSRGLIWAEKGDSVQFIERKSMNSVGFGQVKNIELVDVNTIILEFESKMPEITDDAFSLENLTWTPNVTITNCFAGSCRGRGYLVSTPGKVVIENNIFETSGSAILIPGDASIWYESGAVKDVTIRNNEFRSPCNSSIYQFCEAVISIYPEIPEPDPSRPFHKNITIENNTFNPSDYPILYALSVDGLNFINNTITRSYEFEPWHHNKHSFIIKACKNVNISGNKIDNDVLGKNILLENMSKDELHLNNAELSVEVK